ncbi:MAG: hypothetical protein IIZ78_04305 [Clostridiales bacterium]|nr:hypothetical protein [Clostridiales bacterium]
MTDEEIKKAIAGLHSLYPKYNPPGGWPALLEIWELTFADVPKEDFKKAMSIHIKTGKRLFPSASELDAILKKIRRAEQNKRIMTEAEKIAHANDNLPTFESSGCTTIPCPYLQEGQTDFCTHCVFEGGTK